MPEKRNWNPLVQFLVHHRAEMKPVPHQSNHLDGAFPPLRYQRNSGFGARFLEQTVDEWIIRAAVNLPERYPCSAEKARRQFPIPEMCRNHDAGGTIATHPC